MKKAVPASRDANTTTSTPRTMRRASVVSILALLGACASAACTAAPTTLDDGLGSVTQNTTAGNATHFATGDGGTAAAAPDCSLAEEGCPCDKEGDTTACAGPKIRTGNYTSCAPGTRACVAGLWGACLGKAIASESATLTQDYGSPCHDDETVHWGPIDVKGSTPSGANIDVLVQAAASESRLSAAPVVRVAQFNGTSHGSWASADVDAALAAAGVAAAPWLRITLSLTGSQINSAPSVTEWRQESSCTPSH